MKTNTSTIITCLGLFLALTNLPSYAGQVYSFKDRNGVKTMSKTLPPYAAQRGYEILDDASLRVIEKVAPAPTKDEIAEYDRQQMAEKEQKRLAAIEAKNEKERHRQAMLYDANLKASYRTEGELLKKRETELLYFQNQIEKTKLNLKRNKDKLHQFQQKAANIELSGLVVTGNLKKRLVATEQEIKNNYGELERLSTENKASIEQYDQDLNRLRELLKKSVN
jgi:hypothetical protein